MERDHLIAVEILDDKIVLDPASPLEIWVNDSIAWHEKSGKRLKLVFESEGIFKSSQFVLCPVGDTHLIAQTKGTYPYKILSDATELSLVNDDPKPTMPIIIIVDPPEQNT